jgi:hypothetical protein
MASPGGKLVEVDTGALAEAIRRHYVVELVYAGGGSGAGARLVHPHALYRTTRGGLCLDAWQVAGVSTSPLPAWKQFHLMKVAGLRATDTQFEPASDFDPNSPKYSAGLIASV